MISTEKKAAEIVKIIKEMVKEGDVIRIIVKKDDTAVLSIPMDDGTTETRLGAVVPAWELLLSGIAAIGPDCTVTAVKSDGSNVLVYVR